MISPLKTLIELIYPPLCPGCGVMAPLHGHFLCLDCLYEFPETGQHEIRGNPFENHFEGRVPIRAGAAFLYFSRGGNTQKILHQIKYGNRPELGRALGEWYGRKLKATSPWTDAQVLIPVPLHWKKQRIRGYNQSALFGQGLSESMHIPLAPHALQRTTHDSSLTGMSRFERIATIQSSFVVRQPQRIRNQHVLLIDDVLTTGATLEACATAVLEVPAASIMMSTLATGEL